MLSGLEYLHWPESIIFLLLQNLQMGKLCQSFVGHEIRARELASLTKFKCSQTSAKTARCICHQRVNTMYNGRFHWPVRLWSLSHATGKTTLLILGPAFPEALSSINTACAHTGRMSLIQHSFNKCLLCPLRKPRTRCEVLLGHVDPHGGGTKSVGKKRGTSVDTSN